MARSISAGNIANKAIKTGKSLGWSLIKDTLVGLGLLVVLSGTGAVFGKNYYQKYNDGINKLQDIGSAYIFKSVSAAEQGIISPKQADAIQSTVAINKPHYFMDFVYSIPSLDKTVISEKGNKLWEFVTNPEKRKELQLKAQMELDFAYNGMVSSNNEKKSYLETALDEMDNSDCGEISIQKYKDALGALKKLELPTDEYELDAEKVQLKCAENFYFDELSNMVLKLIEDMKSKNFSTNDISIEVDFLFGNQVTKIQDIYKNADILTPEEKQNMQEILKYRTEELSKTVSSKLECLVKLEDYL